MKIAEIFYSVQGEGTLLGVPSVFVRSSGCNLRCSWCDTPYTSWTPEGEEMSLEAIAAAVAAHPAARHVVITGGEPLIQPQIGALTRLFRAAGLHITIETAGTVAPEVECDLYSISPKLANSTPAGDWAARHERTRINREALTALISRGADYQLKFVIATPADLAELTELTAALGVAPGRVLLMPEGTSPELLRERALWLVGLCLEHGYRYTPRLHVDLWGNRRGV